MPPPLAPPPQETSAQTADGLRRLAENPMPLPGGYCLVFVRGISPEDVVHRLVPTAAPRFGGPRTHEAFQVELEQLHRGKPVDETVGIAMDPSQTSVSSSATARGPELRPRRHATHAVPPRRRRRTHRAHPGGPVRGVRCSSGRRLR
ncbi:hypothetical protein ACQ4WX_38475 [Streptomyces lasalocidi]